MDFGGRVEYVFYIWFCFDWVKSDFLFVLGKSLLSFRVLLESGGFCG